MICVEKFEELPLTATIGEHAYCSETKQVYEFTNFWRPYNLKPVTTDVNFTQYELNKMLVQQMPDADLAAARDLLHTYTHSKWHGYFMLLCNDIHYYTVLDYDQENHDDNEFIEDLIIELLQEKGTIKLIDYNEDKTVVECWIANKEECLMFLLFDYDWGVLKCQ